MSNGIKRTHEWIATAFPNPTNESRMTQIGVHFEEVAEMFESFQAVPADECAELMHEVADGFKTKEIKFEELNIDRQKLLDALTDQIVTAVGVAYMFDLNVVDALEEINRSNFSKFVDGKAIYDVNGKIAKGPDYVKADLSKFV